MAYSQDSNDKNSERRRGRIHTASISPKLTDLAFGAAGMIDTWTTQFTRSSVDARAPVFFSPQKKHTGAFFSIK